MNRLDKSAKAVAMEALGLTGAGAEPVARRESDENIWKALGVPRPKTGALISRREDRLSQLPDDPAILKREIKRLAEQISEAAKFLLHPDSKEALNASRQLNQLVADAILHTSKCFRLDRRNTEWFKPEDHVIKGLSVMARFNPRGLATDSSAEFDEFLGERFKSALVQALHTLKNDSRRNLLASLEQVDWLPPQCRQVLSEVKDQYWYSPKARAAQAILQVNGI